MERAEGHQHPEIVASGWKPRPFIPSANVPERAPWAGRVEGVGTGGQALLA